MGCYAAPSGIRPGDVCVTSGLLILASRRTSKIVSGATLLTLLRSCAPPDSRGGYPHVACGAALGPFSHLSFGDRVA